MSGCSSSQDCPRCNGKESLMVYTDWKPFSTASGECVKCGFSYYTKTELLSLEDTNNIRLNQELKPIKKLKKGSQDFDNCYQLKVIK